MTHKELLRLTSYASAQKLHTIHSKRSAVSRRAAKSVAKGLRLPLKNSRVFSMSTEKLQWSPWKYKSVGPDFRGQTQAS